MELNVIEQCLNLYKTGDVQRKRAALRSTARHDAATLPRSFRRIHFVCCLLRSTRHQCQRGSGDVLYDTARQNTV